MLKSYIPRLLRNKILALPKQTPLFSKPSSSIFLQSRNFLTVSTMIHQHLPKTYADVNSKMPVEYYDYENYENTWGFLACLSSHLIPD